jgi:hypothetical protein
MTTKIDRDQLNYFQFEIYYYRSPQLEPPHNLQTLILWLDKVLIGVFPVRVYIFILVTIFTLDTEIDI